MKTTSRRLSKGPLLPNWTWTLETGTRFARDQFHYAFELNDLQEARSYVDSLVVHSPALDQVQMSRVDHPVRGTWLTPKEVGRNQVMLFFHGGGYCYDPISTLSVTALIALETGTKTFSFDYRLSPEYAFPAQLEDAIEAYEWLLESGNASRDIILAGASSGGHLCLSLLLALRERQRPLPVLAICLSPWVDIGNSGESMILNEKYDMIEKRMCDKSAAWFLRGEKADSPAVSPFVADLHGLPPIYLQAGGAEIFIDMIEAFAKKGKDQGAEITLDVWENMNHVFQAYGHQLAESREALTRIREVVEELGCDKEAT